MLNGLIEGTQALATIQDRCSLWDGDKIASCRDCPHYPVNKREYRYSRDTAVEDSGWTAAECQTRPDCPLNPPRPPVFASDRLLIKDYRIPCDFPGCDKYCDHDAKIELGNYCDRHYRTVYNRKFKLNWPAERLHEPVNEHRRLRKCSFPGCEEMHGGEYCKYHRDVIRRRKHILKWPDERLLDPINKHRRPRKCAFPGCEEAQNHKYCRHHSDVVRTRKYKLKWPEKNLHDPIGKTLQQCIFPGCKEVQGSKYCKLHADLVRTRKNQLGWSEERLHDPVKQIRKPKRRKK